MINIDDILWVFGMLVLFSGFIYWGFCYILACIVVKEEKEKEREEHDQKQNRRDN